MSEMIVQSLAILLKIPPEACPLGWRSYGTGDIAGLAGVLASTGSNTFMNWGKAPSTVIAEGIPPILTKLLEKIQRWEFMIWHTAK